MELQTMHAQLAEKLHSHALVTATISQPRQKSNDLKRIKLKPVELKEGYRIQFEYQYEQILKHQNLTIEQAVAELEQLFTEFRQGLFQFTDEKVQIQLTKKFKVSYKSEASARAAADLSHNRKKDYLLEDGIPYPFLVRLGVQSPDGKVKKQKYDKFRQINRFIEFIDDALEHLPKDHPIRILDFGSGKSYLTFALYHYLRIEKGLDLRVTGLDLKKSVIEECQNIARDLDYQQLEFLVGDINDYDQDTAVDMVVTLHACDVATDMALARAVKWNAGVILSVPCCQHELNSQIQSSPLDVMLQHGLIKERFSALATDSIRAELLSLVGYETQLMEFIDMEHTPKNILIRAYRTNKKPAAGQLERYQEFTKLLNAKPFLENELKELL
ncbi:MULTISPECIES: SAM-dependent methyltransferase [unclassified Planococcus (in: firmicutes)]|uniref:class I SAM-dependent methyltransferase n=1 Tax=unclassified Planococcus (in: firmicutes) TaxID=2662419 RepID=UPI000C31EFF4|nr:MULTISPECIES: SAM-dependent methyltransferase [unclassified Planococcus (in: firmicutes)]AUD12889.1 SAM-dependent methyltransferase [Planococcus sp. MB-3u-03]PKG47509.1 SAM-dependent methyltransferase [Planococcus sp. Urea-trap-24]PKG88167.1 SAM-dependent methyltransferase [Planococcus sp. Urea-3u-39]PKH36908.1 SAM-dependent methyltransferase [Planococcus sp. MB-3u-09]